MRSLRPLCFFVVLCLLTPLAQAQVRTAGQIVGIVEDPSGAVVPGAKVVAVDEGTGLTKETTSGPDGRFVVPDLPFGFYRITVTVQGFRTAVYSRIKVDVGLTSNVTVKLEVGPTVETITVTTGTEVLQTSSPQVESSVSGRTLRSLPLNNRDVLDFVLLLPGANQAGQARQSTFANLPKGAINITMDGLNVQDNLLKSSFGGGMFTLIRPKLDNVEEISVTSFAGGADAAGEGAVQIRFVTRRGTNDYHGTLFEYWRHEQFNANTWINNANGRARNINRLHQYGFALGGPFIRDKVFFFVSYEDFRLPAGSQRTNQVLKAEAQQGIFPYKPGTTQPAAPNAFTTCDTGTAPNQICRTNLLALAGANSLPNTIDPLVQSMLDVINPIVSGQTSAIAGDLFRERFIFAAGGSQRRWFPTLRLDYIINDKLRWSGVANFNRFLSSPDTLNRMDPAFPGTGFQGGQYSNRMSLTTAVNWDIKPNLTYEFRVGRQSSVVQFFPETLPGTGLPNDLLDLYTRNFRLVWPLTLTSLHARPSATEGVGTTTTRSLPSSRTTPVLQWGNNVGWLKGKHSFNFGTNFTVITSWDGSYGAAGIPTVSLGVVSTDSAVTGVIAAGNLPGISNTDRSNARALYALLTGRISSISGSNNVDEITKEYKTLAPLTTRDRQNEFGVYVTDQWRLWTSLTVTAGLRWEYQGIPYNRNGIYTSPTFEDIWGKSGVGNLFMPGTLTGIASPQIHQRSRNIAGRQFNNWAPSLGLAWAPKNSSSWYKWIFGGSNKSVFRAGYSIAYTREGFSHFQTFAGGNPGLTQSISGSAGSTIPLGSLVRNPLPPLSVSPPTFSFPTPMSNFTFSTSSLFTYDPNIKPPYVQSWSVSWQREIDPNTVVEVRYVGNHGMRLWRGLNLNEVNIFDNISPGNGFLQEFNAAKSNLNIFRAANPNCGRTGQPACNFGNTGLTGQVNLPIMSAAFTGVPSSGAGTFAGNVAAGAGFANTTFVQFLDEGQAGNLAASLATQSTYFCRIAGSALAGCQRLHGANALGAGRFAANLFMVNPDITGVVSQTNNLPLTAGLLTNGGSSTYNALHVEVRRRLSKGFLVQANYSFSKGLTNRYDDSATSQNSFTTMRNPQLDKGLSPYDITHTMRLYWVYELPFGPGRKWGSSNAIAKRIIEGWEILGVIGLQSGRPFLLTSGRATVNQYDSYVVPLVSREKLQDLVRIVQVPGNKFVYFFDPSAIGSDGRACGANPAIACANPVLAAPATPGEFGQKVFLHGPIFYKPDLSIAKKITITERIRLEFRAEFFNAFNYTNWLVGGSGGVADVVNIRNQDTQLATVSQTFGQTTNFLNDLGNQDQGPRMLQFVLRLTF